MTQTVPGPTVPQRGWLAWASAALFYAFGFLLRVSPGVMADGLMRDFGLDGTALGTLAAAYFYAYAFVQMPAGLMLDRLAPGRLLSCCAVLAVAGAALFALAPGFPLAFMGRAMVGAGVGAAYIGSLKIAALHLPPERFGLIAGLTLASGTAGAIIGQAPLALPVALWGWRPTMLGLAAVGMLIALSLWRFAGAASPRGGARGGTRGSFRAILARRETWLLVGICASLGPPILALGGLWGIPFLAQVYGLTPARAGLFTSLLLLAWTVAGPVAGGLSDVLGRRPVLLAGAALQLAGWVLVSLLPAVLWLSAGLAAIGFGGGAMVVAFALARDRLGRDAAATGLGIVNSGVLLFGALLQSALGLLLDRHWEGSLLDGVRIYPPAAWRDAWISVAVLPLVGLVCSGMLERSRPGESREHRERRDS